MPGSLILTISHQINSDDRKNRGVLRGFTGFSRIRERSQSASSEAAAAERGRSCVLGRKLERGLEEILESEREYEGMK